MYVAFVFFLSALTFCTGQSGSASKVSPAAQLSVVNGAIQYLRERCNRPSMPTFKALPKHGAMTALVEVLGEQNLKYIGESLTAIGRQTATEGADDLAGTIGDMMDSDARVEENACRILHALAVKIEQRKSAGQRPLLQCSMTALIIIALMLGHWIEE